MLSFNLKLNRQTYKQVFVMKLEQIITYGNIDREQENYLTRVTAQSQENEVNFTIKDDSERLKSIDLSQDEK